MGIAKATFGMVTKGIREAADVVGDNVSVAMTNMSLRLTEAKGLIPKTLALGYGLGNAVSLNIPDRFGLSGKGQLKHEHMVKMDDMNKHERKAFLASEDYNAIEQTAERAKEFGKEALEKANRKGISLSAYNKSFGDDGLSL